jgi:hypothetical protein
MSTRTRYPVRVSARADHLILVEQPFECGDGSLRVARIFVTLSDAATLRSALDAFAKPPAEAPGSPANELSEHD